MKHVFLRTEGKLYSFAANSVVTSKVRDADAASSHAGVTVVTGDAIFYAGISLLNLCNLTCRHCPVAVTTDKSAAVVLSHGDFCRLASDLASAGLARASLTGGEPFLHPALTQIGAELSRLGVEFKLNTNGTRSDLDVLERLVDAGLSEIDVSINDVDDDEAYYWTARNVAPQRIAALRTISARFKGRLVITASSVLTARTVARLSDTLHVLADCGVDQWRLREYMLPAGAAGEADTNAPEPRELVTRLRWLSGIDAPIGLFGYLLDIAAGARVTPRCSNLEDRYVFIQYDRRAYWMHGLLDAYAGLANGSNARALAAELAKIRRASPIGPRCAQCPARRVCLRSPNCDATVAELAAPGGGGRARA